MDLTVYFSKIRDAEAELPEPCVVVSRETGDGGKAGVRTEVPRRIAARMIVEGRARVATEEEALALREEMVQAKRAADELAAAGRMQVAVIPSSELRNLRTPRRTE